MMHCGNLKLKQNVFRFFKTIFKKTGFKKFVTCNETWTFRHDAETEQSGKFQILNHF